MRAQPANAYAGESMSRSDRALWESSCDRLAHPLMAPYARAAARRAPLMALSFSAVTHGREAKDWHPTRRNGGPRDSTPARGPLPRRPPAARSAVPRQRSPLTLSESLTGGAGAAW